jgi:hypothetical protein
MSKYWITPDGNYYEGDFVADGSIPVTQRPTPLHVWDGEWIEGPPPVPEVLTPAQFWMQLAIDGDEDASLVIIDTLPRPQQILALRARQYERGNELLIQLATAMGKSSADIDAFFREAAEL